MIRSALCLAVSVSATFFALTGVAAETVDVSFIHTNDVDLMTHTKRSR